MMRRMVVLSILLLSLIALTTQSAGLEMQLDVDQRNSENEVNVTPIEPTSLSLEVVEVVYYPPSPYLIPESVPAIGELHSGEGIAFEVVLREGAGADSLGTSTLYFKTELEDPLWKVQLLDDENNPFVTISRGSSEFTLVVDHQDFEKVSVVLSGKAPEVSERTQITAMGILQTVNDGGQYETLKVVEIKSYVSSSDRSDALSAIQKAEEKIRWVEDEIQYAKRKGADTSLAESELKNAKQFLENAKNLYNAGNFAGAHSAALSASASASKAYRYVLEAMMKLSPKMSVSPREFKTDLYQGSETTFGIVIEETAGFAPIKNVELKPVILIGVTPPPSFRTIPPEWISFDKNNFDVPAGGKVTVNCKIKVPKDAEPGGYYGTIEVVRDVVKTKTGIPIGLPEYITIEINVLRDAIPPEIIVYSPKDGEVVFEPYVTIKGVARDNIGIKSLKISKLGEFYPLRVAAEKERGTEVKFKDEMQLEKGWNYFTIEAEDFAGNRESKTISVRYIASEIVPDPYLIPESVPVPINLQSGEDVTLKVMLRDPIGGEDQISYSSILYFRTELEDPVWTVQLLDEDDNPVETISKSSSTFTIEVDHQKFEKISVGLTGKAPAVSRSTQITAMQIRQQIASSYDSKTIKIYPIKTIVELKTWVSPLRIVTPTPPLETPPPPPTSPTPAPKPELEELSVSIHPKHVEAKPGDTINYTVTIDWYPPEWKGEMKISAVISAAGFEKRFELPPVTPGTSPPVTNKITIPVPENVPPLTCKLKLEVEAGSLSASDETELVIKLKETPGFEALLGILAIIAVSLRKIR